jgi:cellulose synthase/poly-beta-1,6-N-acetylglucosamine synthase-like glycosyltransferase
VSATLLVGIAVSSTAFLLYTYLGYPLLVALLARLFPRRPGPNAPAAGAAPWRPTVSVLLPVSNSSDVIDAKLTSLIAQNYPASALVQILVYDDGSTDDTVAKVRRASAADERIELVEGGARRGKPTALNALAARARGEVLLMTDARQPLAPFALAALVDALADPQVGCAAGNLVMHGQTGASAYWRYEKWIRDSEGRFSSLLGVSGALYALRRGDLAPLPEDIILDDMWVPLRLRLRGRDIVFVPAAEFYDQAFDDDREFKRKVRTLAGNYQLLARLPRLLLPFANPSWFELASHKIARLVCPWALVALALSTLGFLLVSDGGAATGPAARWMMLALGAGQAVFYGAALAAPALPGPLGKLARLCRTFVVLNAAAVVGLFKTVVGGQRITW